MRVGSSADADLRPDRTAGVRVVGGAAGRRLGPGVVRPVRPQRLLGCGSGTSLAPDGLWVVAGVCGWVRLRSLAARDGGALHKMRTVATVLLACCGLGCAESHASHVDAGVACRWQAPPSDISFCNVAGSTPCDDWAASMSVLGRAVARCWVDPRDASGGHESHCANADRCAGGLCTCGSSSECPAGSACMLVGDESRCVHCAE